MFPLVTITQTTQVIQRKVREKQSKTVHIFPCALRSIGNGQGKKRLAQMAQSPHHLFPNRYSLYPIRDLFLHSALHEAQVFAGASISSILRAFALLRVSPVKGVSSIIPASMRDACCQ